MTPACGTATPIAPASALLDWPLTIRLELGAYPSAVPCARLHTRLVLREWDLAQLGADAELVVSELATNAIKATTDPFALTLQSDRRVLLIDVWDAVPDPPRPRPHAIDADSGRGLELITMLSQQWGVRHPDTGGKSIWVLLPISR